MPAVMCNAIVLYLVLLLTCCWLVTSKWQYFITISSEGVDDSYCLEVNQKRLSFPCKTLSYVLQNLPRGDSHSQHSYFINLTYNQSITSSHVFTYKASPSSPITVIVSGVQKPFINCFNYSSLKITSELGNSINWSWIGIGFSGCRVGQDPHPGIFHENHFFLSVLNCAIKFTDFKITDATITEISNSEFGNMVFTSTLTWSSCPIFTYNSVSNT